MKHFRNPWPWWLKLTGGVILVFLLFFLPDLGATNFPPKIVGGLLILAILLAIDLAWNRYCRGR